MPPTSNDLARLHERLHERIDDLQSALAKLNTQVSTWVALCKECRRVVAGNGRSSLDKRVSMLETQSDGRTKSFAFWAGVLLALSCTISGVLLEKYLMR